MEGKINAEGYVEGRVLGRRMGMVLGEVGGWKFKDAKHTKRLTNRTLLWERSKARLRTVI